MLVSAPMAPGTLLWPGLPTRRPTLAALACQSTLQGNHPRQTTPSGTGPTLSQPPTTTLDLPRSGASVPPSRGRATPSRARASAHDGPSHHAAISPRGPAPSKNSGRPLRPALRPARLLCRVLPHAALSSAAFLFLPLPSGVATRTTTRSPAPKAAATRCSPAQPVSSRTAGHCSVHVVTY
jgi:hypothetical protein